MEEKKKQLSREEVFDLAPGLIWCCECPDSSFENCVERCSHDPAHPDFRKDFLSRVGNKQRRSQ
ncbi:MAG: hypothetical protein WCW25_00605 [Patescibacteria group bacterium]